MPSADWKLVIHGGAGVIRRESMTANKDSAVRAGLERALAAGERVLADGGSAVDAVEAAVRVLEDDEHFNAGRGSVLTEDGGIELDASIMDGASRAAGAIAGATTTRSPVALARAAMDRGPHVFLSGPGADQYAREHGLEQVASSYFETAERRDQLERLQSGSAQAADVEYKYGTVGAVARDQAGHVAAATSTGGTTGKRRGRIGDSPVIGAGCFADDRACAVSATGQGEFFLRAVVAHEISARMRLSGEDAQTAADAVMAEVRALGGEGGVIVVNAAGETAWSFNTPGMYRGMASPDRRSVAIYSDE